MQRARQRETSAKYRARLGRKYADRQVEWKLNHPGKQAEYARRYKQRHPEMAQKCHADLRAQVIAAYGGECVCCGEAETAFLVLDHVLNDGADHRQSLGNRHHASGAATYRWLRNQGFPQDGRFQLLCANCNMAKRAPDGCPHKRHAVAA